VVCPAVVGQAVLARALRTIVQSHQDSPAGSEKKRTIWPAFPGSLPSYSKTAVFFIVKPS
jgi:hypothetical protein